MERSEGPPTYYVVCFHKPCTQEAANFIVEKLTKIKPKNLSQASRIDGVTPAALSVILSYIKTKAKSQKLA